MKRRTLLAGLGGLAATGSVVRPAAAQTVVGVTATEIKIGHTIPYSGNASSYSVGGKSHAAYYKRVNDMGGVGGRKQGLHIHARSLQQSLGAVLLAQHRAQHMGRFDIGMVLGQRRALRFTQRFLELGR